jgi:hypothetical protein
VIANRAAHLVFLLAAACSGGTAPDTSPDPEFNQARVHIENRASLDMDVYLIRSDGREARLGFVAGGETATFALPATLTAGANSITFAARPVRRSGQSVTSEPFGVGPGEEITWSISPQ